MSANVAEAFGHFLFPVGFDAGLARGKCDAGDYKQQRNIAQGIEVKARGHTHTGDGEAGQRRAKNARAIVLNGVEGNGVQSVLARNKIPDGRRVRGGVEGDDDARQKGDDDDLVDLDDAKLRGDGERKGENHHGRLGTEQHGAARRAVGDDSAEQRKHQSGNLLREADHTEPKRGIGELQDKPALRHVLHPGADVGDQISGPEKAEFAVAEGAEPAAARRKKEIEWPAGNGVSGRFHRRWNGGCVVSHRQQGAGNFNPA